MDAAGGWPDSVRETVMLAALIHDCGVSSANRFTDLVAFECTEPDDHCIVGNAYLQGVPMLTRYADLVRHHHLTWYEGPPEDCAPGWTRLAANLIYLADRLDVLLTVTGARPVIQEAEGLVAILSGHAGTLFAPAHIDALRLATRDDTFWTGLAREPLQAWLDEELSHIPDTAMSARDLFPVAHLFARIVDAKSTFTAQHSLGVAALGQYLAEALNLSTGQRDGITLAGLLHDIGKLGIPDDILDKPTALTAVEWRTMQTHASMTEQLVGTMLGDHPIVSWAAAHHETPCGDGYPLGLSGEQLSIEMRIIAAADVFQALAQERPYRPAVPLERILDQMSVLAAANRLDARVVSIFQRDPLAAWECAVNPMVRVTPATGCRSTERRPEMAMTVSA